MICLRLSIRSTSSFGLTADSSRQTPVSPVLHGSIGHSDFQHPKRSLARPASRCVRQWSYGLGGDPFRSDAQSGIDKSQRKVIYHG